MLANTNMKKEEHENPGSQNKRPYRMVVARAKAAEETGQRILEAVLELHTERYFDQVSLEDA